MDIATKDPHCSKPKESLDLSHSSLTAVPDLARLRHLHVLRLDSNFLEDVPWAALMELKDLTDLNVSHNRITKLPRELAKWNSIRVLNVSHNRIASVDRDLWPLFFLYDRLLRLTNGSGLNLCTLEHSRKVLAMYPRGDVPRTVYYEWHVMGYGFTGPDVSRRVRDWVDVTDEGFMLHDRAQNFRPRLRLDGNPAVEKEPRLESDWRKLAQEWREAAEAEAKAGAEQASDSSGDSEGPSGLRKERRRDTRSQRREQRERSRGARNARDDKGA